MQLILKKTTIYPKNSKFLILIEFVIFLKKIWKSALQNIICLYYLTHNHINKKLYE